MHKHKIITYLCVSSAEPAENRKTTTTNEMRRENEKNKDTGDKQKQTKRKCLDICTKVIHTLLKLFLNVKLESHKSSLFIESSQFQM